MVRENQGLQIALIVFVMITILLGVTTYMFFSKWSEACKREDGKTTEAQTATSQALANAAEVARLKQAIGLASSDKTDFFADDMKKYGNAYPEEARFYRPLLAKMAKTIDEANAKAAGLQSERETLKSEYAKFREQFDKQLKTFEQERDKAREDLAAEQAKFKSDRDRNNEDKAKLNTDLAGERKKSEVSAAKMDQQIQAAGKQVQKLQGINTKLSTEREKLLSETFENAEGDIRWINQRTGTVWISLGRADALQRQITFSVYPGNAKEGTTGGKKGSVEVTQILGDHLAEARVYDDKIGDPIVPGDKIFTPVWTPGEKRHFALAGFMDIDGDGKTDILKVRDIIVLNGGIVDAYVDEKGKVVGALTLNTRYVVKGEAPNEKGESSMPAWTKIMNDAERYRVQKLDVNDLLGRMGWKNQAKVVAYGAGSNTKDFAAKAEEGPQKKSTGNVSGSFGPRTSAGTGSHDRLLTSALMSFTGMNARRLPVE